MLFLISTLLAPLWERLSWRWLTHSIGSTPGHGLDGKLALEEFEAGRNSVSPVVVSSSWVVDSYSLLLAGVMWWNRIEGCN